MKNLRKPLALALTVLSLCVGASALAQTTVSATVGTTTPPTGTAAPVTQTVPKGFVTDLAKASLAKQGITNPTKAQLDAESKAIAAQRAQGQGWGVIAQSLGLNLGQVVSAANQARRDARKEQSQRNDSDGKGKHKSEHKSDPMPAGGAHTSQSHGSGGGSHGGGGSGSGGGGGKGK